MEFDVSTITAKGVRSLCWVDDTLVDWAEGGARYHLYGTGEGSRVRYAYKFDGAVVSPSGRYAVIYERFGTKGLVLDGGEVIREINRSFYQADVYEYPVALLTLPDGTEGLAHCPDRYCVPEIEVVESGTRLTTRSNEKPADFFHSRFCVSRDGEYLLSAGWIWHPFSQARLYRIRDVLADPFLLDKQYVNFPDDHGIETYNACFLNDGALIMACGSDADNLGNDDDAPTSSGLRRSPGSIALYDVKERSYRSVAKLTVETGPLWRSGLSM